MCKLKDTCSRRYAKVLPENARALAEHRALEVFGATSFGPGVEKVPQRMVALILEIRSYVASKQARLAKPKGD